MTRRVLGSLACVVALVLAPTQYGYADDSTRSRIDAALSKSLELGEAEIRSLGESVSDSLNKKIEFARSGGDLELLEKAEGELDAFLSTRRLPTLVRTTVYERSLLGVQRKMLRAYDDAISDFVKAGLIDDAKLVRKTKAALERQIDDPVLGPYIGRQLIANPGCEKVLPNGHPFGWTSISGSWTQRRDDPKPSSGEAYFFAGKGKRGEIVQLVDLRPIERYVHDQELLYEFNSKLRCWGGHDTAEVFLEFWNDKPEAMIESQTTGPVKTRSWTSKRLEGKVPADAVFLRVRMVSTRFDGSNNDGYFDDLSLVLSVPE